MIIQYHQINIKNMKKNSLNFLILINLIKYKEDNHKD